VVLGPAAFGIEGVQVGALHLLPGILGDCHVGAAVGEGPARDFHVAQVVEVGCAVIGAEHHVSTVHAAVPRRDQGHRRPASRQFGSRGRGPSVAVAAGHYERAAADRGGDSTAAERAHAERQAVISELRRATGLAGRPRRAVADAERARVNVTRTIRAAIDRITAAAPIAGAHLQSSIRTGTACRYEPSAGGPSRWLPERTDRSLPIYASQVTPRKIGRRAMTASNLARNHTQPAVSLFGRLAGQLEGGPDQRPPLVLLHGLTFDSTMWDPARDALRAIDPGRQALVLDLPGHGRSPRWPSYDLDNIVDGVHQAVEEAELHSPVLVGHSYSAVVATTYAARHSARGVINVDQWLQMNPVAELIQSLAPQLRGPGFPAAWQIFQDSMHVELLPAAAQELVRSTCNPRQDLVTGYWREVIDTPAEEMAGRAETGMAAVRALRTPYLFVAGHEPEPGYRAWLQQKLPQVSIVVWPGSGHFPHLAHPGRFAKCMAGTGRWTTGQR
jgi:pimeloyl-ACP methyl ester carboxylesterase